MLKYKTHLTGNTFELDILFCLKFPKLSVPDLFNMTKAGTSTSAEPFKLIHQIIFITKWTINQLAV